MGQFPAGAITGSLSVRVNDAASAGGPNLTILGDFDVCGNYVEKMISLASGRMAVLSRYGYCALAGFEAQGAVTLQDPGEPMVLVTAAPRHGSVYIVTIAADKAGSGHAVISYRELNNSPETIVNYKGTESRVTMIPGPFPAGADFDSEGNLYFTSWIGASAPQDLYLVRLSAEDLARGGAIGYTTIAQLPVSDPVRIIRHRGLSVSCEGRAYIGIGTGARADFSWEGEVREIDLATGAVTNTMALNLGWVAGDFPLLDLALTGNPGELIGSSVVDEYDSDVEVWRGVMGQQAPTRVAFLPNNWRQTPLTVAPNGDVYIANPNGDSLLPLGYKVQVVDPCPGAACPPPRPQPYCNATPAAQIEILPSTKRWKAQRGNDLINVDVGSSVELDIGQQFTLRYTGKEAAGTTVVAPTTEITLPAAALALPPQGYAYGYTLSWNGVDATGANLPTGNYTLVVRAPVLANQSPAPPPLQSAEYSKVSLVEVTAVAMEEATGLTLSNNPPALGGGKRIFAEAATQPGGTVTDKLKITATVSPPVLDAPPGQGVRVYFRSFDVDDPSSATAPVDDESQPTDNCLEASAGPPQNCPIADAGFLYDAIADPNAGSPMNGAAGIALDVAGDKATAGLRVAMLPGANYRVAASTSSEWLGTLSAPGNRTDGAVLEGTAALSEATHVTPLLTVWRTLSLQLAAMPAAPVVQSAWEHQATAACPTHPCIQGNQLFDTNGMPHPDHLAVADAWLGAEVDVTPATPRTDGHVVVNSTVTSLTALTPLTPFDPAFNYALWDDEVASSSIWAQADESLARTILHDAFIDVRIVPGVNPRLFRRNLSDNEVAALPGTAPSSVRYWTAPVVLVFEGDEQGTDGDPATETSNFGLTNGVPLNGLEARQPRVGVFAETIRDYSETPLASPPAPANRVSRDEILTNTTAHEILHLFGLIHDGNRNQGAIMCASLYVDANEAQRTRVTPDQLRQLRMATEMKIRRSPIPQNCP